MANEQNLIRPEQRTPRQRSELARLGGLATKGLVRYSQTKCKNCQLPCPIKDEGIKEGWVCKVPDMKRQLLEAKYDPTKLNDKMFQLAFEMEQMAGTDFYKKERTFNAALNLKREINPSTITPQLTQINNYFFDDDKLRKFYDNLRRAESPTMDTGNTGNNTVPVPDKIPD